MEKMKPNKPWLDVCCGGRMFYPNKNNEKFIFMDIRDGEWTLCDGRIHKVHPDIVASVLDIPYEDNSFYGVVFDPPHLKQIGDTAWMAIKYGKLPSDWQKFIHDGFQECMRVLRPGGVLCFKWNTDQIPIYEVIGAIGVEQDFGTLLENQKTYWQHYIKPLETH